MATLHLPYLGVLWRLAVTAFMSQLIWGLGWKPETLVMMLWHYLDESGEHSQDGALQRLTVAGGLASSEQWKALDAPWKSVLAQYRIDTFHMSEFEAWRGAFDFRLPDGSRDKEKHRKLLNALLELVVAHVDRLVGFVAEPTNTESAFEDSYKSAVSKSIRYALLDTLKDGESVTMVFAKHKDFKGKRVAKFFEEIELDDSRLNFGGICSPDLLPQLQVADIVAYECSRWSRKDRPEKDRYPLTRLIEGFRAKGSDFK